VVLVLVIVLVMVVVLVMVMVMVVVMVLVREREFRLYALSSQLSAFRFMLSAPTPDGMNRGRLLCKRSN
jgi:hypothetical protein